MLPQGFQGRLNCEVESVSGTRTTTATQIDPCLQVSTYLLPRPFLTCFDSIHPKEFPMNVKVLQQKLYTIRGKYYRINYMNHFWNLYEPYESLNAFQLK